ncbi:MAG: UDP-3-O-(3-hydroxymyristoyl)glucosamine N-acyltransferase [Pseudomonadota bacterium]
MIDPRFYRLRSAPLSVADLCALIGLQSPEGTLGDTEIVKPADLASSEAGDVSFLESKRHLSALETAKASACFVPEKLAAHVADRNIVPLVTPDPKYRFARATDHLVSPAEQPSSVSNDADIHSTVQIGPGVQIGAGARVGPNSVLTHCIIGAGVRIGACTVIGGDGFGVAASATGEIMSVPHIGRVVIGDRVRIGSNVCIDRGQLGDTRIDDDCQIDNLVQIGHNCHLERGCMLAGRVGLSGSCHLEEGVMMGGSAGLADHIRVGKGARLAAFAGVMHDVPAGETWSGIPAMPIRQHMKIVAHSKRAVSR